MKIPYMNRGAAVAALVVVLVIDPAAAQEPVQIAQASRPSDWRTATELPRVDFAGLSPDKKAAALQIMREESCTCGCGMKIAECRIRDSSCPLSPGVAAGIVRDIGSGKSPAAVSAALGGGPATRPATRPAAASAPLGATVDIPIAEPPYKGPKDARVTIVEFSDFQCPFCARFAPWADSIVAAYPDDVKLVFKQFPLSIHAQARLAAEAALAAHAQGKFWELHDKLFANFRQINRDNILAWATEVGLDAKKMAEALDSGEYAAAVDRDLADGQKAGVRGTPSFYLNGKKYDGPRELDAIRPLIEAELRSGTSSTTPKPPPTNLGTRPTGGDK